MHKVLCRIFGLSLSKNSSEKNLGAPPGEGRGGDIGGEVLSRNFGENVPGVKGAGSSQYFPPEQK